MGFNGCSVELSKPAMIFLFESILFNLEGMEKLLVLNLPLSRV
jgi:hypothetical protein